MPYEQMPTVEILKQFLEAFNRHDLDAILEFFADDCSMGLPRGPYPWGTRFTGREQVGASCASRFAGLPHAHYGDGCHWLSGNMGFRNGRSQEPRPQVIEFECGEPIISSLRVARSFGRTPTGRLSRSR